MKYFDDVSQQCPTRSTADHGEHGHFRTVGRHGDQWRNHDSHGRIASAHPAEPRRGSLAEFGAYKG